MRNPTILRVVCCNWEEGGRAGERWLISTKGSRSLGGGPEGRGGLDWRGEDDARARQRPKEEFNTELSVGVEVKRDSVPK